MPLLQEQERRYRQSGDLNGLSASMGNQAAVLTSREDCAGAAARLAEEEAICRRLGNEQALANCLANQASLHRPRQSRTEVSIPTPHPAADPERAAQLNMQYQSERKSWEALPWWRRLATKKPQPPQGI